MGISFTSGGGGGLKKGKQKFNYFDVVLLTPDVIIEFDIYLHSKLMT